MSRWETAQNIDNGTSDVGIVTSGGLFTELGLPFPVQVQNFA